MKDVLKAQSGEQTHPRQTAFGAYGAGSGVMQASFGVSSLWTVSGKRETIANDPTSLKSTASWEAVIDPVNGKVVQNVFLFHSPKYATASIADLGKPENVSVAKALGLEGDDTYRRADMLGSAKRVAKDIGVLRLGDGASPPKAERGGVSVPGDQPHVRHRARPDLYVLSVDVPEN